MYRKSSTIHIICFLTKEIEHLRINHGNQEIEGAIRIRHNQKQGCLLISQSVQLQFIISCQIPELLDIKGCQSCTTGNQNGLGCFSGSQLVLGILPYCEMVRVLLCKFLKHQIHRIFELFIILPDFHCVDHFKQGRKILLLFRSLIMDVPNQCGVKQCFRFQPEIISAFALPFCVGNQCCYQFQNILLRMEIGKWIIMH